MTRVSASAVGAALAVLVAAAALLAWGDGAPSRAVAGGLQGVEGSAWPFLGLLIAAYAVYALGLAVVRRGATRRCAVAVAVVVQLSPLAAPLLLSTDAWSYWSYGWIARSGESPYDVVPADDPANPALPAMGADWRDTTSVYGPVFTLVSEPVALVAGDDADVAAWAFKALAAAAVLAATLLAARLARRPPLAAAYVGWNPLLAIHAAGGGHNDALVGALLLAALALEGARRTRLAGVVWAAAILVKWVPAPLLALRLVSPSVERRGRLAAAVAVSLALLAALTTWRYGTSWLGAAAPLVENAARETSYAVPARLEQLGMPDRLALTAAALALAVGAAVLVRQARRGAPRLGSAACVLLLTTPYLAVWYLAWAVPLAGADDDDRFARGCLLALGAYLLPQAVPV